MPVNLENRKNSYIAPVDKDFLSRISPHNNISTMLDMNKNGRYDDIILHQFKKDLYRGDHIFH
jgi:hypothetical protein